MNAADALSRLPLVPDDRPPINGAIASDLAQVLARQPHSCPSSAVDRCWRGRQVAYSTSGERSEDGDGVGDPGPENDG